MLLETIRRSARAADVTHDEENVVLALETLQLSPMEICAFGDGPAQLQGGERFRKE